MTLLLYNYTYIYIYIYKHIIGNKYIKTSFKKLVLPTNYKYSPFLNYFLAGPLPTLGHHRKGTFTHPMLILHFYITRLGPYKPDQVPSEI